MSLAEAILILVVGLVAWEAFIWALKKGIFGIALFRLGIALRKQLPVGRYRWERENSIAVGKPDSVVVFRMPLQPAPGERPVAHVAVTDAATSFTVGDEVVAVDPFLEAYDAELGPLEVQVFEAGKIAEIGIATDAAPAEQALPADSGSR